MDFGTGATVAPCDKGIDALLVSATVDAHGVFTSVHAGTPGSVGSAGVYAMTKRKQRIKDNQ